MYEGLLKAVISTNLAVPAISNWSSDTPGNSCYLHQ